MLLPGQSKPQTSLLYSARYRGVSSGFSHTPGKAEDSFQLWLAGLPVMNYSELNKETQFQLPWQI